MSYDPLSNAFYLAMAGDTAAQGAGGRPITSTEEGAYARECNAAYAFAEEFDTLWGNTEPDLYQAMAILQCCEAYWRDRDDDSTDPTHYEGECQSIIALILEGSAVLAAGGITPPPFSPSGGGTLASGWGQGTTSYDTAGEVGATTTLTPASTGKLRVWASANVENDGDAAVALDLSITIGDGTLTPAEYEITVDVEPSNGASPSFSVDLDRLDPPYVAAVGDPVTINVVGKTTSGSVSNNTTTIAVQERSE
jgi:hypothetical protein